MHSMAVSFVASTSNSSQRIAVGTASVQTSLMTGSVAVVTPDVTMFYRAGANPTALADGTDQVLLANNSYRIMGVEKLKLAFIAPSAGNVYITQEP